ncbi:stage III sporulation protein AA [Porcipelethomonas sp.]|uniref:stage III sporulation protein AA n=1 Tax=Porcipelethomonas sp. TaxID=2981675 RepID=UPI003EF8A71C
MADIKNYKKIISYFPERISGVLSRISAENIGGINEIRLRVNRPVSVSSFGQNYFVTESGSLTEHKGLGITAGYSDINECFKAVCDYSVHSYLRQISEGFITIEGGNRVGICGTAVTGMGGIETLKYISGLNFRIAGQVRGCGEQICLKLFKDRPSGLLIIGPPLSGKTTVLKDMCRILGEKYRISVIDERSEIGAVYHGQPQNDIGPMTDIFDGYPKGIGITSAVRVMSPDIIVCDEIGGSDDCKAIAGAVNSGVKFIASVHGSSFEEISSGRYMQELIKTGIFQYYVLLGSGKHLGEILTVRKII